jgi:hypothetical protein
MTAMSAMTFNTDRHSVLRTANAGSSHVAMIKRFAKFVLALATITLVVAAVGAAKLAIYYPRFFH